MGKRPAKVRRTPLTEREHRARLSSSWFARNLSNSVGKPKPVSLARVEWVENDKAAGDGAAASTRDRP